MRLKPTELCVAQGKLEAVLRLLIQTQLAKNPDSIRNCVPHSHYCRLLQFFERYPLTTPEHCAKVEVFTNVLNVVLDPAFLAASEESIVSQLRVAASFIGEVPLVGKIQVERDVTSSNDLARDRAFNSILKFTGELQPVEERLHHDFIRLMQDCKLNNMTLVELIEPHVTAWRMLVSQVAEEKVYAEDEAWWTDEFPTLDLDARAFCFSASSATLKVNVNRVLAAEPGHDNFGYILGQLAKGKGNTMYVIDTEQILRALATRQVTLDEMLDKLECIPSSRPVYEWLLQCKLHCVWPKMEDLENITPELRRWQVSLNYNIFD